MTYILKVVDLQFIIMLFILIDLNIEMYGQLSIDVFLQNFCEHFPISYYFQLLKIHIHDYLGPHEGVG